MIKLARQLIGFSIALICVACSTPPQKAGVAIQRRSPSSANGTVVPQAPSDGAVWNSEGQLSGLDSINIAWQATGASTVLKLRYFYVNDLSLRGSLGFPSKFRFLPDQELTFNTATGILYLGERRVGHWNGHPDFRGAYLDGFSFEDHFTVDQKSMTINILPNEP